MITQNPQTNLHDAPTGGGRRKASNKKYRPPLETHEYYMGICINADGYPEIRSSAILKPWRHELMFAAANNILALYNHSKPGSEEVHSHQHKGPRVGGQGTKQPAWHDQMHIPPAPPMFEYPVPQQRQSNTKRRRMDSQPQEAQNSVFPAHNSHQPTNQAELNTEPVNLSVAREQSPARPYLQIEVCDTEAWTRWFGHAFRAIQQQACRTIAKEWIKLIHPKKQSTHPYNGNFPRHQRASPERTRPPYWPPNIRHKEPDHIDKDDRTTLLVHLIIRTPQQEITPANPDGKPIGKEIFATDLGETLAKKKDELKDKWEIIEAVIRARSELEQWEDGGYNDDTQITVPNYEEINRPATNSKKQRVKQHGTVKEEPEDVADGDNDDDDNDNDRRCAGSPTPVASPGSPSFTPADSVHEDDMSVLNASFSSTVTQNSSRSFRQMLRPKPDRPPDAHLHTLAQPPDHPQTLLHAHAPMHTAYGHHGQIHHGQTILSPWPATTAPDPHLTDAYTNGMMVSQGSVQHLDSTQFDPSMYSQSRSASTSGAMPLLPYHEPQHYGFGGYNGMNRDVAYRPIASMVEDGDPNQAVGLQDSYCQMYAQFHQP